MVHSASSVAVAAAAAAAALLNCPASWAFELRGHHYGPPPSALILSRHHTTTPPHLTRQPSVQQTFLPIGPSLPHTSARTILHCDVSEDTTPDNAELFVGRRHVVRRIVGASLGALWFPLALLASSPLPCSAAAAAAPSTTAPDGGQATVWLSGKPPRVPGAKPKDPNDTSGTRKDPRFLRSISDCKNQCENSGAGSDGFSKTKEECLSECQDVCCTTYEQCTFAIVPRI